MTTVQERLRRNALRLAGGDRLAGIDLARGLAVLGMLAAHLLTTVPFELGDPSTWLDLVNGRSSILFCVLAGFSIALVTGGQRPITGTSLSIARRRLLVRAAILWILGIVLIATGVPVYVILPAYALLFVLALAFVQLRAMPLMVIAIGLLIVMPFVQAALELLPFWETSIGEAVGLAIGWAYPFPLWAAFLVLGLALGRMPLRDPLVLWLMLLIGAAVAMFAAAVGGMLAPMSAVSTGPVPVAPGYLDIAFSLEAHSGGLPEVLHSVGFAVAVIAASILVCKTPLRIVLFPLRAVGSMPLTAYTAQIVVWAIWAFAVLGDTSDLFGFRALEPFWPITIGIIVACSLWSVLVGRGPLEALLAAAGRRVGRSPVFADADRAR